MENVTLLEQEVLEILKQLQYRCDEFELHSNNEGKEVEIMISDIDPRNLKRTENLYNIEKYLQKSGIDFSITFDLVNDSPLMHIDHKHPTEDYIQLGVIKGENIQEIKAKIKELINKLDSGKPALEDENISIKKANKLPDTVIPVAEDGMGYLMFHGEKIPIGEILTSKFRLAETLCGMGLGKGKTIDTVFDYIKAKKDKSKIDTRLDSQYQGRSRKLELIKNQMREVNRTITEYTKQKKLKKMKFRLKIKSEDNNVWMEEKVVRRG